MKTFDIELIPESISVTNNELLVRFDKRKFWTMNRIEFQGKLLGIDECSSHYGTVLKFHDIGFIGSGHTENASEQLMELEFYLDGKQLGMPPENGILEVTSFKIVRNSNIREFRIRNCISICEGNIGETVTITSAKSVHLDLMYNFMHPWIPEASDFIGKSVAGTMISGSFSTNKELLINKPMEWISIYSRSNGVGMVSCLIEQPDKGDTIAMIWDQVPYKKFYTRSFSGQTFPEDYVATYRMVTTFFTANEKSWEQEATEAAIKLNKNNKGC